MQYNNTPSINSEPVTACIYDEQQAGVWLVFTKDQPEFIANVDKCGYQKILNFLATCSSMRNHIYNYFDSLKEESKSRRYGS